MGELIMKNGGSTMKGFYATAFLPVAFALLMNTVPACANPTDDIIESAAKESYVFKNYLHNDSIMIESNDGVVTLTGLVSEEPHKALAQEIVESIVGVKSVDNQLEVKSEISDSSDALIMYHRSTSALRTKVGTRDGVVTLSGTAQNASARELATPSRPGCSRREKCS